MIGRPIKTGLPQTSNRRPTAVERRVKANDLLAKQSMKRYADEHRNTRRSSIAIGDNVLILRIKNGKKTFGTDVYKVIKKTGSQVRAQRGDHIVPRNSSFFKVVHCRGKKEEDDETFDIDFNNNERQQQQLEQPRQQQLPREQQQHERMERPVRNRHPPQYLSVYVRK